MHMHMKYFQSATYRFLISTAPLKAFLGTPWIWFSLRSLDRKERKDAAQMRNKGGVKVELSQAVTEPLALQHKYLM